MANKKEELKETLTGDISEVEKEEETQAQDTVEQDENFFHKLKEKFLKDKEKELEELKDALKRTQAEFLNFKRRTEREKEDLSALANERIVMELLPVLDNFERGLDAIEDKESPLYQGMELICKQLFTVMEKNGVEQIDTTIDFDPNFHHAVMQEEGEEKGKILEVFQKGYLLKNKVIRPAMVKVSN